MRNDALESIKNNKVLAVIRANSVTEAYDLAQACIDGGLKLIEITFSFPKSDKVITKLSKQKGIQVGAGTVLNLNMAKNAINSGAKFIVSPHTDKEIIIYAKSKRLPVVSGALTSSEIVNAWNIGADFVKIFPVKYLGGPSYVKAIKDPLPFVSVLVTGGVKIDNFTEYLTAGASLVGISSDLIGGERLFDLKTINKKAREIVDRLYLYDRAIDSY